MAFFVYGFRMVTHLKLSGLGINQSGDSCLIELPNGTYIDIEQQDESLYIDEREVKEGDSLDCIVVRLV